MGQAILLRAGCKGIPNYRVIFGFRPPLGLCFGSIGQVYGAIVRAGETGETGETTG